MVPFINDKEKNSYMERQGWKIIDGKEYCDECSKRLKDEKGA
jgi:hypothetical protein